ncbi:hypothetical protein V5056_26035, partial [Escherichia coli]|uniref:hypothetical protein n=1 Tax=Escherichia coli TaxID=562 RepID=UPI0030766653
VHTPRAGYLTPDHCLVTRSIALRSVERGGLVKQRMHFKSYNVNTYKVSLCGKKIAFMRSGSMKKGRVLSGELASGVYDTHNFNT